LRAFANFIAECTSRAFDPGQRQKELDLQVFVSGHSFAATNKHSAGAITLPWVSVAPSDTYNPSGLGNGRAHLITDMESYSPQALIQLRGVEKTIKSPAGTIWLLRRINLDLAQGEFVTIMGPSGAGKTTLMSILGMLDDQWAGEYYFAGEAVHKMNRKQRSELNKKNIGFVFQSYHLLDNLTVAENLDLPLSYKDIKKSERSSMVCDTLDRFNIVGKKDLYPNQLSGGQQQLVGVARAVINKPKLILADEPTGNLHSDQAREIMELFRQLNEAGTTIIQVTHSEANAAYGSRTIKLLDGWIVGDTLRPVETGALVT